MSNEVRAIFYHRNQGETYPGEPVVYVYADRPAYQADMNNNFALALDAVRRAYPNKEIFPNAAYLPGLTQDQNITNTAFNSPVVS